MFCFVCVATVFGYILGVNRVIDAIISKHSDETRVKTLNKYTQTNLSDLADLLTSNNMIISHNENNVDSKEKRSCHADPRVTFKGLVRALNGNKHIVKRLLLAIIQLMEKHLGNVEASLTLDRKLPNSDIAMALA